MSKPIDGCWKPKTMTPFNAVFWREIKTSIKPAHIKLLPDGNLQIKEEGGEARILGIVTPTEGKNEFIVMSPDGSPAGVSYKNNEFIMQTGGIRIHLSRCVSTLTIVVIGVVVAFLIMFIMSFLKRKK